MSGRLEFCTREKKYLKMVGKIHTHYYSNCSKKPTTNIQENWRTRVGKDVGKSESLCIASRNVTWHSHCGKQYGDSSNN
jgi:hypothetical protein